MLCLFYPTVSLCTHTTHSLSFVASLSCLLSLVSSPFRIILFDALLLSSSFRRPCVYYYYLFARISSVSRRMILFLFARDTELRRASHPIKIGERSAERSIRGTLVVEHYVY